MPNNGWNAVKALLSRFLEDESGAQMAEYGLLLVLIGVMLAAVALWLSGEIQEAFEKIGLCIRDSADGDTSMTACPTFTEGG